MVGCKRNKHWPSDEGSMGHNSTCKFNFYTLIFTDKTINFQPFATKGWPHYDATFDFMPKKIKGTHVFWPSNGSSLLLSQTHLILLLYPPLLMTTTALENSLHSLLLLLLLLTHDLLPSWPAVAPNINNLLTSLLTLYIPLPMTSCQCQMWTSLLLTVRPVPAQSNRRSMDQQPSYQPVKNSRASIPPSKTFWNPKRWIRGRSNGNGPAQPSIQQKQWWLFRNRRHHGLVLIIKLPWLIILGLTLVLLMHMWLLIH